MPGEAVAEQLEYLVRRRRDAQRAAEQHDLAVEVVAFAAAGAAGQADTGPERLKVPHMGWNKVRQTRSHPIWAGIPDETHFYFVHSYYADPADPGQSTEARALSYLHANCGHCHSDHGGGAVPLRLKFPVAVDAMKAVGVRPLRGDFTLPDACIIKPGDPDASTLYYRMSKFGRDRMPQIPMRNAAIFLAPDWVCEVISPSTEALDRRDKMEIYARELVAHYWLIDPRVRLQ